MQSNQIIAVWGNSNSGKTAVSIKLANELAKDRKNVVIVLCDTICPSILTILSGKYKENRSLGNILETPFLSQEIILENCAEVGRNPYICLLGYSNGENTMSYAKYSRERAIDLFILLRHLADYVIVDCMSNLITDLLSTVALEVADRVIRLSTADLKGMFFFQSNLPLLADRRFEADCHMKVLSNTRPNEPRDIISSQYQGVFCELPHTNELINQYLEGRLFEPLEKKESRAFQQSLQKMRVELLQEENEKPEAVSHKKSEKRKPKEHKRKERKQKNQIWFGRKGAKQT